MEITQELVKEIFDYKDGFLYKRKTGKQIGTVAKIGKGTSRRVVRFKTKLYYTYQLIFLWHYGYIPELIDHKDKNSLNDKIDNLREATREENSRNCKSHSDSTSKHVGVFFDNKNNKWVSEVFVNKKKIRLGYFSTEEEAAEKRQKAVETYFNS